MSYQVLARKWRPRSFREMVGQTHVLKALINALDTGRLHHAYLFTGTRGVGKTTIARIMAKCLNCEQGVSSSPCGTCSICREIDEGRFVDLIEVDAASKTKVEDTRELLDNVQYMPSRGRYKVYLIDEVHMLSTSSFNALLKTLEEPPPHVKFLLATTDPQRLPPTVLSRCLQFSLKNMPPEPIVGHLSQVLTSENVPFEEQALWLLGRAADGSMRDAMSLTDQAVAFGEGKVLADDVRAMLGTLDQGQVFDILQSLVNGDAAAMLKAIRDLAEQGPDWLGVLAELLEVLHRVAIAQVLPQAVDNGQGDREQVLALANKVAAEDIQFYYQLALVGRRDLPLAPEPRDGFEMVMLRMLAFRPASLPGAPRTPIVCSADSSIEDNADEDAEPVITAAKPASSVQIESPALAEKPIEPDNHAAQQPVAEPQTSAQAVLQPAEPAVPEQQEHDGKEQQDIAPAVEAVEPTQPPTTIEEADEDDSDEQLDQEQQYLAQQAYAELAQESSLEPSDDFNDEVDLKPHIAPATTGPAAMWVEIFDQLGLTGMTASIARNCALAEASHSSWTLHLDPEHCSLFSDNQQQRIAEAINRHLGREIELEVVKVTPQLETPALALARKRAKQMAEARQSIEQDSLVQTLIQNFGAKLSLDSIRPLNPI